MTVQSVIAQQVALYGEPLSTRFARLLTAFAIPQSRLAAVIGLSAPMLSQLASGQRVKISNPAVYARLLRLEELAASSGPGAGDPAQLRASLDEVSGSRPQLTTDHAATARAAAPDDESAAALAHLARIAPAQQLVAAAAAVPGTALAALLAAAAQSTPVVRPARVELVGQGTPVPGSPRGLG